MQIPGRAGESRTAGSNQPQSELERAAVAAAENPSDRESLRIIFESLYEPVLRFMRARSDDWSIAEDLAQEVFVRVVGKIESYSGGSIHAWIFAIARNVYSDHYRPRRNRGFEQLSSDFTQFELPSDDIGPEEIIQWSELGEALRVKLASLPCEQQRVIELRVIAGLTASEVGQILGKPSGTVRVLQYRALAKLRKLMPSPDSRIASHMLQAPSVARRRT
ncbi:sigma-70 family RNA polymerase sigma factor [Streptomyces sp. 8K308]|uniref:RNA polymerase sigma factor n=1 Tax=Streptomyces sp. 8K308 TaxID=2530388 RepID=UPI00104F2D4D|nr:sigma-70 family RNA polymerase sigma factor [Streptomyces sp. 8K308]TDC08361.1 sigma-70 family RNA polymerase sigma factor [Streptomyces sp. 8K308]